MNGADYWQNKIIQLFHDPPVKVFRLFQKGGHVRCAQQWLDLFTSGKRAWLGWPKEAQKHGYTSTPSKAPDLVSTGADRPVLGSFETRVDWWKHPISRHPLDGATLEWPVWDKETVDRDVEDILRTHAILDWDDPAEVKNKFLWLWRSLPDLLMSRHGPLWSVLPADSRIPDHSIWDHLRMASAYTGATNRPHLFIFSVGPVQTFIYQARTSRDLWVGSYLLSDLIWAAMKPLVEALGPDAVIYPSLFNNPLCDQWLERTYTKTLPGQKARRTRSSMLPNKFVALLPGEIIDEIAEKCREGVKERWRDLSDQVREYLERSANDQGVIPGKGLGKGHWTSIWDRQLSETPTCRWVAAPWKKVKVTKKGEKEREETLSNWLSAETWQHYEKARKVFWVTSERYLKAERGFDYSLTHHKAQVIHAARKRTGGFDPACEPGIKCSVCGEREVLHYAEDDGNKRVQELRSSAKEFWKRSALDPEETGRERLCGVCTFKRFLTETGTDLKDRWLDPSSAETGKKAPFPSTSSIAALPFLLYLVKKAENYEDRIDCFVDKFAETGLTRVLHLSGIPVLEERVNAKNAKIADSLRKLFEIDAEYLFPEIWDTKIREADDNKKKGYRREAKQAAENLVKAVKEANKCPDLSRHFALLMMDGDNMGRLLLGDREVVKTTWEDVLHPEAVDKVLKKLSHTGWPELLKQKRLTGPALHAFISRLLAHFAYEVVPWLVEKVYQSRLIYVGGDDLLVMAPADKVLSLAWGLQRHFSASFLTGDRKEGFSIHKEKQGPISGRIIPMLGRHASLSASIIIAHHKEPLRPLLAHGRYLLNSVAKDYLGRSAVAISVFTRSGEKLMFGGRWMTEDSPLVETLNDLADGFRSKKIPSGFPYKLLEMQPAFEITDDPGFKYRLVDRILEKGRGADDSEYKIEKQVKDIIEIMDTGRTFAKHMKLAKHMELHSESSLNGLLLARFLGLRLNQGGGE